MSTPLSRREFLRNAMILSGGAGAFSLMPATIARAAAIEPDADSTFMDAEHVVILMQENRSFDHVYGTLSGVRGFDDPRAITLADGNPVWLQTDRAGRTHAPWHLDIHGSKSTWTSCLPHGRGDQLAANNGGKHDGWLDAKRMGAKDLALLPLTLGHYDRRDVPFYYAFADAFTVFDQNFSSVCSCTTPNRNFLWSGTNRDLSKPGSAVAVHNEQSDHVRRVSWPTFPERLENAGVSWKTYSNEIDLGTGLSGEEDRWLGCYGDNPLEYFTQYHAEFAPRRREFVKKRIAELKKAIAAAGTADAKATAALNKNRNALAELENEYARSSPENFAKLPPIEQALHRKAFVTNEADPNFRKLASLAYDDKGKKRTMKVPAGDVLYQFRKDTNEGKLPTVSWLVAPENFSDHPSAAWFGSWYLSEVLDILTKNPAVWKKTVFILTYDENDGYFDHIPPYSPPKNGDAATGLASPGLDTAADFDNAGKAVGLGFRVPMVVASPWTRGGQVCSQITDHTSVIRFLEVFLTGKTGKAVVEPNISPWRRAVCGDLTAAFRSGAESGANPKPVEREPFLESIDRAKYLGLPEGFHRFTPEELAEVKKTGDASKFRPKQEPGSRPSVALPYELYADAKLDRAAGKILVTYGAGNALFGEKSTGAPFKSYAPGKYKVGSGEEVCRNWNHAVKAGDRVTDDWSVNKFEGDRYFLRTYGPNGFYREFLGRLDEASPEVSAGYGVSSGKPDGSLVVTLTNPGTAPLGVTLRDVSYGAAPVVRSVAPGATEKVRFALVGSAHWYDLEITVAGAPGFSRRLAGRCETGRLGRTDPLIGRRA